MYEKRGEMACSVEELIEASGRGVGLQIDLKEMGYEEALVRLLVSKVLPASFVITSLEDASIQYIKQAFPAVRCGLSLGREVKNKGWVKKIKIRMSEIFPGSRIKNCQADFISINYRLA